MSNDASGALVFDIPTGKDSVNYIYNVHPPKVLSGNLVISVAIIVSGAPWFNYMLEPFNTCVNAPTARPFFQAHNQSWEDGDRWWSNPTAFILAPGAASLTIPLDPIVWSGVNGRSPPRGRSNQPASMSADRCPRPAGERHGDLRIPAIQVYLTNL